MKALIKTLIGKFLTAFSTQKCGKHNVLHSKSYHILHSKFIFDGNNNSIEIGDYCRFENVRIYIKGSNNSVYIDNFVSLSNGDIWIEDNGNSVHIGDNTCFTTKFHIACMENTSITIGKKCLFGADFIARTGDSHSIIDVKSGERTNPSQDIKIGDHVWFGNKVTCNKGVIIPNDSIVASNTVVTKKITEDNVIIGGIPARIIKQGVTWEGDRI